MITFSGWLLIISFFGWPLFVYDFFRHHLHSHSAGSWAAASLLISFALLDMVGQLSFLNGVEGKAPFVFTLTWLGIPFILWTTWRIRRYRASRNAKDA